MNYPKSFAVEAGESADGKRYDLIDEGSQIKEMPGSEKVPGEARKTVKFEVFGEEMLEKMVKLSGNSGRIYLPPDWVGHRVKVIRID